MKRKIITSVIALVCAMVCVFALTGCSNDPKKIKSDKVTAAEWEAAFKAENFKNVKIESTVTEKSDDSDSEQYKVTVKATIIVVDDVQYYKSEVTAVEGSDEVKEEAKELNFEQYSSLSDGKYTVYTKVDGKWTQSAGDSGVADAVISYYVGLGTKYEDFEHQDGWVKGYWLKENTSGLSPRSYKFKKGKLVAVCTYEEEESTSLTYGKQKLTLPTV